jgi:hypothetical protein
VMADRGELLPDRANPRDFQVAVDPAPCEPCCR